MAAKQKHKNPRSQRGSRGPKSAARLQRNIQREVARNDRRAPRSVKHAGMQAGARPYPVSMPAQHRPKPGRESELNPAPMYDAPYYRGSGDAAFQVHTLRIEDLSDRHFDLTLRTNLYFFMSRPAIPHMKPGPVWTPLNPSDKPARKVKKFGQDTPMGRPAQPEEIAPAYVFLASAHCSSYITGEILPIIGGYSGG